MEPTFIREYEVGKYGEKCLVREYLRDGSELVKKFFTDNGDAEPTFSISEKDDINYSLFSAYKRGIRHGEACGAESVRRNLRKLLNVAEKEA